MTNEEINREVAEKVMGWEFQQPNMDSHLGWWKGSSEEFDIEDWRPSERIDHAWMVLEKFSEWTIYHSEYTTVVIGDEGKVPLPSGFHGNICMAICLAALEAVVERRE